MARRKPGSSSRKAASAINRLPILGQGEAHAGLMPAPSLDLLETKLHVPRAHRQLVQRSQLLAQLTTGLDGKLTLLSAPAGFGKTTLLSAWRATAHGRATPCAWVSLDTADSDPLRFWRYVIAALDTLQPGIGASALALLQSFQPPAIEVVLTQLLNALNSLPTDIVLVLDDYHLVDALPIHTALGFMVNHLPPQVHLVLSTRADPPLQLTRLRARQQLTELRAADLRFTADETATFLTELMGLPLSTDDVLALEARTEGWIVGLQFAALAMRDRSDLAGFVRAFTGSHRFVVDYLAEEVLARQPPHLLTFLTQTAILDRMCGPLCDALLGLELRDLPIEQVRFAPLTHPKPSDAHSYSQPILDQLERANLFIVPLDDDRQWYRYHHLFAEVLRERLLRGATPAAVMTLHQRASHWYEQVGLLNEAIRYAILAPDLDRAALLIEQYGMTLILGRSEVLLVQAWLEQLPHTMVKSRPRLALIAGFTLALRGQFAAVVQLLIDAQSALSLSDLDSNSIGELALLHSTVARLQGHAEHSLHLAQHALVHLRLDNYSFRAAAALNIGVVSIWSDNLPAATTALTEAAALGEKSGSQWIALAGLEELTSLQSRQGQLRNMLQTTTQAAQLSLRLGGQTIPAAGMIQIGRAEVWYEWNDLFRATQAAREGIILLQGTVERKILVRGYIILAQVHQVHGDYAAAMESLRGCEEWFTQTRIAAPSALAWLATYRARLWLRHGNLSAAMRWAQQCSISTDDELAALQQLTFVRLHLAYSVHEPSGQQLDQASNILEGLLPTLESHGWMRYLIDGLILQALVDNAQHKQESALIALQRTLALAEPEGYVRSFVDEGMPIAVLLALIAVRGSTYSAYAARLLEAFPQRESEELSRSPASLALNMHPIALVEPLSAREHEILRLIAVGYSNQVIADQLVVALSTVKKHVNNLYGKLGVQSRTQALARAHALNLL